MSVTEIASALGEWNVTLRDDTPLDVLDSLGYFGHIAVLPSRIDPNDYGDSLLDTARYVGVNRGRSFGEGNKKISGPGMAFWLGDEDDKGHTIEEPGISLVGATFTAAVNALLPPSVQAGTISALPGLYTQNHLFQSRRKALDYLTSLYNAEWRVRGNGLLDAGAISDLYVTQPKTAIIRNREGLEMDYRALPGRSSLDSDIKDFTTRLLLIASGTDGPGTLVEDADINPVLNPYVDLFGNPIKLTRIVSETSTDATNAAARAQLQLNRFTSPRDSLKLSTAAWDIRGDVAAGDYVWVYDRESKLVDEANQIDFHGETMYPLKLRVFQLNWPITKKMGVAFRTNAGVWIDLTDYVVPENGDTEITVGGYNRSLTGVGSGPGDQPGSIPTENTDIPDVVTWVTPFSQSTFQSDLTGETKAQIVLKWNQPLNTDTSVIMDGFAYEIRYRTGQTGVYDLTHADLSVLRHNQLTGTFGSPIPYTLGAWNYIQVSWDFNEFLLLDLTPGIPYDFQIRALDQAVPPNVSPSWSSVVTVQTRPDTRAPSTPAPCQNVAGSRNAVQIVHTLGKAEGGTYNLEADINHLEIHCAVDPTFITIEDLTIDEGGTLLGKVAATQGMLRGKIPVVATFQLDDIPEQARWIKVVAVDNYGNRSGESAPMQQTAVLIDSAFISELTVSKVSAGTIVANWIQAAEMATALTGARVKLAWFGIEAYNISNIRTFYVNSATGDVTIIGKFIASDPIANPGDVITLWPSYNSTYPTITFESSGSAYPGPAYMNAIPQFGSTTGTALGLNSGPDAASSPQNQTTLILAGAAYYLQYNTFAPTSNNVRGARHYGDASYASMAHFNSSGQFNSYVDVAPNSAHMVSGLNGVQFYSLGMGIASSSGFGRWERNGIENSGNGYCAVDLTDNGVKLIADGLYVFSARNGNPAGIYAETNRYCGFNETQFRGQMGGSSAAGDTFSMQKSGAGTDPAMFCDGFAGRFVKNFVIDHPEDKDRWLVHACTEGPTAGVEYSGKTTIVDYVAEVELPPYFESATLPDNRQIFLQVQLPEDGSLYPYIPRAVCSPIRNGKFRISSDGLTGTIVSWLVKAVRSDVPQFPVTPKKSEWARAGDGPYTYLERTNA